jgi:hypothetical protein
VNTDRLPQSNTTTTDLAVTELACWRGRLQQRATLAVVAALLALLGLGLAGVAGLLAAALPLESMPMPSLLWVLPAVPLVVATLLAWRIRQQDLGSVFSTLREQMAQDHATLKLLDKET